MKIVISINEVLRDFVGQFLYTYDKYIEKTNYEISDIDDLNLTKFFKFNSIEELNKFLYLEAPLEIFGHADLTSEGLMTHFNRFIEEMKDEDIQTEIVSREVNKGIPSTFFFLSKTGCRIENIRFVSTSAQEWGDGDILITANPDALLSKPINKISIKIKTAYNKNVSADYELDSILDIIKDENLINKIMNTKITTCEEI
jgi:hypothetical protein